MNWTKKSDRISLDLVASGLRSEVATLTHVLETIEASCSYQDSSVYESIKSAEINLRRLRKFIGMNLN